MLSWTPVYNINKLIKIKNLIITITARSKKDNLWGRFGGGWNIKLGFQIGSSSVIVSLLLFEISFRWKSNK